MTVPRCVRCKGAKNLCGDKCKYLSNIGLIQDREIGQEVHGMSPPAVFVGRHNYPKVNLGPMVPIENREVYADTESMFGENLEDLIAMRSSLVRSGFSSNVEIGSWSTRLIDLTQEIAMSNSPVDTEVEFRKPPKFEVKLDAYTQPSGPYGEISKAEITENPSIPRDVDYIVSDSDAKTTTALKELYNRGVSVSQTIRLLSSGLLGQEKDRKLVPTRWSITATDSNLSEILLNRIKHYQQINQVLAGYSEYLGNRCVIILIPANWQFELVECYMKGSLWSGGQTTYISEMEKYQGRKKYAEKTAGAYYATKLAIAEKLENLGRQAKVIAIREIGDEYFIPLGVWVVRETMRNATQNLKKFDTLDQAIKYSKQKLKFSKNWIETSKLLKNHKQQKRLTDYLNKKPQPK
ncbi:Nre family DNA repair protein [Methanonatronarchaeum sp. AMET-Sl]|uniref:Nre family DNA repair protein n=1 Tax=Methanonatronarchaeum sp. AMET-Sl TaxID=3037654 RepID=UPI00244DBF5C|nr:Nre family DNA repair protein [Methanonatronarchaeum sp. AMET-Sl]WGI16781.1 Nre family DNA repair protein [Methanonatronarchaeum sp. AMET-Sl]